MPETGELIAGIIGALVGAVAALLSTIYLEHKKSVENKRGIKDIILSDLDMQAKVLKQFAKDFNHLKEHLKSKNAFSDRYDGKNDAYTDNVYKSNTMIEYNATFGKILFIDFQELYEKIILFKKRPAGQIWLDYQNRYSYIRDSNKIENELKPSLAYKNRDDYVAEVDTQLDNCKGLLNSINEIKPKIERLEFPFFKYEKLFKALNVITLFTLLRLLLYALTLMLLLKACYK